MTRFPGPATIPSQRPRSAFVLTEGGSRGAIQAGMLQALYECGIVPDLLVALACARRAVAGVGRSAVAA